MNDEKAKEVVSQPQLLTFTEAITATKADNASEVKNLQITRATYSKREDDGHEVVTLTTSGLVDRYIADNDNPDVFVKSKSKTFVVSLFSLVGAMSQMKDAQVLAGRISKRPVLVESLLPGSTITVLQREVKANVPFMNYFSGKENTIDHDSVVTDIADIKLGEFALSTLDAYKQNLAAALMGDL